MEMKLCAYCNVITEHIGNNCLTCGYVSVFEEEPLIKLWDNEDDDRWNEC